MKPTNKEWFIAFNGHIFKLSLIISYPDIIPLGISLQGGNKRQHEENDEKARAIFSDGIYFCVYTDRRTRKVMGAFFPVILNGEWEGC